jgi:hypothetical protein
VLPLLHVQQHRGVLQPQLTQAPWGQVEGSSWCQQGWSRSGDSMTSPAAGACQCDCNCWVYVLVLSCNHMVTASC